MAITNINPNWMEGLLNATRTALDVQVTSSPPPTGTSSTPVQGTAAAGAAIVGAPVQVGGSDGTNARALAVDTNGKASIKTADGDQATIGITTGAGVTTDAAGTLQQYLRGLIKLLGPVVDVANSLLPGRSYQQTDLMYSGATALTPATAFANVAQSQTDSNIVSLVSAKKIRVLQVFAQAGATATTLTFNSKSGGAGTAISPQFQNAINGGEVLPFSPVGWFDTNAGEGLTVTTGAGSTTGILVKYVAV